MIGTLQLIIIYYNTLGIVYMFSFFFTSPRISRDFVDYWLSADVN